MKTLSLPFVLTLMIICTHSARAQQGPLGSGLFGTGLHANTNPVTRVRAPSVVHSTGTMYVDTQYSVRTWNPRFYNEQIKLGKTRVAYCDKVVDQLTAQYRSHATPQLRAELLEWLNKLKAEKRRLEGYQKEWNKSLQVRFHGDSIESKRLVVERALRMGLAGRELHVSKNRDGTNRVILWHGKPNYGGKPQDISRSFN